MGAPQGAEGKRICKHAAVWEQSLVNCQAEDPKVKRQGTLKGKAKLNNPPFTHCQYDVIVHTEHTTKHFFLLLERESSRDIPRVPD